MAVNMHGMNLKGLKEVASMSQNADNRYYVEVIYNKNTGKVRGVYLTIGSELILEKDEVKAGFLEKQSTMQEIADLVYKNRRGIK